jgi:hypothetical protein
MKYTAPTVTTEGRTYSSRGQKKAKHGLLYEVDENDDNGHEITAH